jgi:phage terminase large subunit-like protein
MARIVIVTYNEDFARRFYDAITSSMVEIRRHYPEFDLKGNMSTGLVTTERAKLSDGTSSIVFTTIGIGFTGLGCDDVIIDDPYRGLEDATSASYRETVESFFVNKLMSRINAETNIYLMYHAWAVGDIGDYAVKKYDFKPVRFPEIADGGLDDPTGREPGEFLSPRMNEGLTLSLRDSDPKMFASMFQGIPISEGERLFEPWMFEDRIIEPYQCPKLTKWYRGVDTATKDKQSADDSATAKIAYDQAGNCFIRMPMTRKVNPAHLNEWMESLIVGDLTTMTIVEEHNAGYGVIAYFQRLPAYRQLVKGQQITAAQGGKRQRALVLADLARQRKVFIVKECEWEKLLDQLYAFTGTVPGEKDDLIDAITVVQTFIKEQKSDYEPILAVNPYNPMNSPSARRLVELKARER